MFEEANLANDHNQLLMDLLKKIAQKHNFNVLLHEKPYEGVNGSGKHNNWALSTNTGVNLLRPGKNPKSNLQFLTFMVNTVAAIHENADVLRASIATVGNDHRLGANEAPPAIMSCFLGEQLNAMLDNLEKNIKAGKMTPEDKTELKLISESCHRFFWIIQTETELLHLHLPEINSSSARQVLAPTAQMQ